MPLLVKSGDSYVPPSGVWYKVDGQWTQVLKVFESPVQNEFVITEQKRKAIEATCNGIRTKREAIEQQIQELDPEDDADQIATFNAQISVLSAELQIAQTEQIVATRASFIQKAQIEYKKLVSRGENAIDKITKMVSNPQEWRVSRIQPISTLAERIEVVMYTGLPTAQNDQVLNYGQIYYRLYKTSGTEPHNDPDNYLDSVHRRLSPETHAADSIALNYNHRDITLKECIIEMNGMIIDGAKRIEDFLKSINDQHLEILDRVAEVKNNLDYLINLAETNPELVSLDGNGLPLSSNTVTENTASLGDILLKDQNVSDPTSLADKTVFMAFLQNQEIDGQIPDETAYPGLTKLDEIRISLYEKQTAVSDTINLNGQLQEDIKSGAVSVDSEITTLANRKEPLKAPKSLFWSKPLDYSSIALSGEGSSHTDGYTSSGTYAFKSTELVELSTTQISIISSILANTHSAEIGVTTGANAQVYIVNVLEAGTFEITGEVQVDTSTSSPEIALHKDSETYQVPTQALVQGNYEDQLHPAIPFVKEVNSFNPGDIMDLSVYHPALSFVFMNQTAHATIDGNDTSGSGNTFVQATGIEFSHAFMVRGREAVADNMLFNHSQTNSDFPRDTWNVNNVESPADNMIFNVVHTNSEFQKDIWNVNNVESFAETLVFNPAALSPTATDNDNYIVENISDDNDTKEIVFNAVVEVQRNRQGFTGVSTTTVTGGLVAGYLTEYQVESIDSGYLINPDVTPAFSTVKSRILKAGKTVNDEFGTGSHIYITFQTGLIVDNQVEVELLNAVDIDNPRIMLSTGNVIEFSDTQDLINSAELEFPHICIETGALIQETNTDTINSAEILNPAVSTETGTQIMQMADTLNTLNGLNPTVTEQLNPGTTVGVEDI